MKKTFKAFLCLLMTVTVLFALSACAVSETFNRDTLNSVVYIGVSFTFNGSEWFGSGTGFFVGKAGQDVQYIITNEHVIHPTMEDDYGNVYKMDGKNSIIVAYSSTDFEEAFVIASDEEKDIAILKIDKPTGKRRAATLRKTEDSFIGSTAYAVGFPALADKPLRLQECIRPRTPRLQRVVLTEF